MSAKHFQNEGERTLCHFLQTPVGRIMVKSALKIRSRMFARPSKIFVWGA
jgi:hypothetical protein